MTIFSKAKSQFTPSPQGYRGYDFNEQGKPVRVNEDGSITEIALIGSEEGDEGAVPSVIANRGLGLEVNLPSVFVSGDVYVTTDTYKVYTAIDSVSWSNTPLLKAQFVTDGTTLYQYNGISLLLIAGDLPIIHVNSNITAESNTTYLIDASTAHVDITLPEVTEGDHSRYYFTLEENSNHCKIIPFAGQTIAGDTFLGLATVNGYVELAANGADGYNIIVDGRVYDRVINVTGDLDLSGGYESGALYSFQLQTSQTAVVLIPDPKEEHVGHVGIFSKHTGDNATGRVVSVSGDFDEIITEDTQGFTIVNIYDEANAEYDYEIKQDSRGSASDITITLLPTDTVSVLEPTYNVLETSSQPEEILTSIPITSTDPANPTSLGFWINDNKALVGTIEDRPINAYAQIKKTLDFNRNAQIKFRYYEYDYETNTLNPTYISETSYSSVIDDHVVYEQKTVGGTLPSNTWAETSAIGNTLVIELLAIKVGSGGVTDDPTIDVRSGGTSPSKTTIDVPAASINHNTLGGVSPAGIGVPDGHINNNTQEIYGNKIFRNQVTGGFYIQAFSATPEFDFDNGNNQQITLTGNITSWTIANELSSGSYSIWFIQDGVGGRTIPDPTGIDHVDTSLGWATTANDINIVNIIVSPSGITVMDLVKKIVV